MLQLNTLTVLTVQFETIGGLLGRYIYSRLVIQMYGAFGTGAFICLNVFPSYQRYMFFSYFFYVAVFPGYKTPPMVDISILP